MSTEYKTVPLDSETHRKVKARAASLGKSMIQSSCEAFQDWLEKNTESRSVKPSRPKLQHA